MLKQTANRLKTGSLKAVRNCRNRAAGSYNRNTVNDSMTARGTRWIWVIAQPR